MREELEARVRELSKRAGLGEVSPRVVLAAVAVVGVALVLGLLRWWPITTPDAGEAVPVVQAAPASAATSTPSSVGATQTQSVWVHVVGAVRHPGLYQLPSEARVEDAAVAAGGFLGNAAPEAVNLARKVSDGEQITFPTQDEAKQGLKGEPSGAGPGQVPSTAAARVNINTASTDELDGLPGVGPATALKIVADREANGAYSSVDDLGRVAGIGPKRLDELKDLVVVR